jgi:hypothetical protein
MTYTIKYFIGVSGNSPGEAIESARTPALEWLEVNQLIRADDSAEVYKPSIFIFFANYWWVCVITVIGPDLERLKQ